MTLKSTAALPAPKLSVLETMELDIVLGRLRPNERLVEDELIARLGAKRHIVRAALVELERTGLVERRPNKGARVRDYDAEEVAEIYELRADLHVLAIARMRMPLDDADIEVLDHLAGAHAAAVAHGDLAQVIATNDSFHDAFFGRCGNRFLAAQIHQLGQACRGIRSLRAGDPTLLRQAVEEHREMVRLARAGERVALSKLCADHIEPSKQLYLRDRSARRGLD